MNIKTVLLSELKSPYPLMAVGSFEEEKNLPGRVSVLGDDAQACAERLVRDKIFSGKSRQSFLALLSGSRQAKAILFLGLGKRAKLKAQELRGTLANFLPEVKRLRAKRAGILLPTFTDQKFSMEEAAQLITESLILSSYKFDRYRSQNENKESRISVEEVDLIVLRAGERNPSEKGREYGEVVATAVNFARDLGNEPANVMTPSRLAQEAKKVAEENGLKYQLLKETDLKRLKMGGVLGVAQGSHEPPQFVILEYRPKNPKKTICLVGKGITFDSGGISLKPAKDMEKMKYDMMGAAAVIASLKAVSRLGVPYHVVGLTPICENLPSQKPQRPGDILTTYNKKTVEVINTDAEGRLILADALSYAEKFKPDAIIDLATLTGACRDTFGDKCMGLMANDRKLADRLIQAGTKSGERCWELPLWEDYLDLIKGDVADLKNVGPGYGSTITAGKFLEQFVPKDCPWVHLDIAGVAWADAAKPLTPKGATGAGIRLICQLLRDWK